VFNTPFNMLPDDGHDFIRGGFPVGQIYQPRPRFFGYGRDFLLKVLEVIMSRVFAPDAIDILT
jgi:hypothetical protein